MAKNSAVPPVEDDPWPAADSLRTDDGALTIRQIRDHLARALGRAPAQSLGQSSGPAAGQPMRQPLRRAARGGLMVRGAGELRRVEPGDWVQRLLATLQAMPPAAFERLCERMLREKGFARVQVTGKSGDGGIDGVGVLRVNLLSFPVLFQCKRYAGSVGSSVVRDFRGAMTGRADKGLIITTGRFTGGARREAVRDGAPAIDLIDGRALCHILKELRLGVGVTLVENVTILEADLAAI